MITLKKFISEAFDAPVATTGKTHTKVGNGSYAIYVGPNDKDGFYIADGSTPNQIKLTNGPSNHKFTNAYRFRDMDELFGMMHALVLKVHYGWKDKTVYGDRRDYTEIRVYELYRADRNSSTYTSLSNDSKLVAQYHKVGTMTRDQYGNDSARWVYNDQAFKTKYTNYVLSKARDLAALRDAQRNMPLSQKYLNDPIPVRPTAKQIADEFMPGMAMKEFRKKVDKWVSRHPEMGSRKIDILNGNIKESDVTVEAQMSQEEINEFKNKLYQGEVKFKYMKKDGTLREARGTMKKELIPVPPTVSSTTATTKLRKANRPANIICYYDLDSDGFRSFDSNRFEGFI